MTADTHKYAAQAAIGWARCSTGDQTTEHQLEPLNAYAATHGLVIRTTVTLEGISGYHQGRAYTQKVAEVDAAIKAGIKHVVVLRLDRLTRGGASDAITTLRRWTELGATVHIAEMGMVFADNAQTRLVMSVMAEVAALESEIKSARMHEAYDTIAAGGYYTGKPLVGYVTDGPERAKKLVQGAQADIVRELFQRCADGDSLAVLCTWLETQGIKRHSRNVAKIIRCTTYYSGIVAMGTTRKPHQCEPLITKDLFDAANAAIDSRRNREYYTRDASLEGLEGAITCSKCGGRLYIATQRKHGKEYQRYQCRTGHGMPRAKAEAFVADFMAGHVRIENVETTTLNADPRAQELHQLRTQLASCNAATDAGFSKIVELRARIAELEDESPATQPPETITWVDATLYATSDWPQRRELVRQAGIKI